MRWGSYPMIPFAGRIRHGRFTFDGVRHQLPTNLGPHAIHGYGYTSSWTPVDDVTLHWRFTRPWPFAGEAWQRFELDDHGLTSTLSVLAHERQPIGVGWHPWFCRDIGAGELLELRFGPAQMYELDTEAIPTGRLMTPTAGPWDNCFTSLETEPVLRWGDALELRLSSSADHWVIFTEPSHALCVEPQTGPPDAVNSRPDVLEPGDRLEVEFRIEWGSAERV